ncbi:MAG TPA: biotin-dependent carboxyltransferase family protein [Gemmata sp.]|nr:biotin-dependent carboxyltransferase family protein [Gemmata sp.]
MSLIVREPGLFSLLVDRGRSRSRSLGVPVGGAADLGALALGNALVGNPPHALALEVTLSGPILDATQSVACIVFGAPFQLTVNRVSTNVGTTFTLKSGDVLRIGGTKSNVRGYLCVAGGFESREILGSCSGFDPVQAGDVLVCPGSRIEPRALSFHTSMGEDSNPRGDVPLRVLDGPQFDWFVDQSFFEQVYEVSPSSNRMGMRLKGASLTRHPGELTSEAVAPGAVQIANDGQPIVLGVDGQTIGGYPKIAHVIRADLDRIAQLRPGDRVRFVGISLEEAEIAARERREYLKEWIARLGIADRQPKFLTK